MGNLLITTISVFFIDSLSGRKQRPTGGIAELQIKPGHLQTAVRIPGPAGTDIQQTLPGIGAGSLLVFILALGYYITPALVGGAADQMISYFIALYTTETVNWGLASALGAVLLLATLLLAAVYGKLVHGQQVTGGMKN
jgi:putative spermidine/putrescine transport system permease protein